MKKSILLLAMTALSFTAVAQNAPQLGQASVDEVIAAMTLDEKAHLVVGTGMAGFTGDQAVIGATKNIVEGAAGTTFPNPRLGIPAIVLADGPAGLRINPTRDGDAATYFCTHFPIGTLLASTWNTSLVESVGCAIGQEVKEYGADVLLAPALNIHRNPLCGRNFEYYSEDPLVAGKIAAAYVRGIQQNGVGTSVKHFAVNNQETNRMSTDARVSQRALREIYLKGFEIVVKEAQPWTVMSSYNHINGTYASESRDLLTSLLRSEWGYKGLVMTDWFGGRDAKAQMIAGNDMLQPGLPMQTQAIIDAVNDGTLNIKYLDTCVRRVLELILRSPKFHQYAYSNHPDLDAHAAVTRQSATEGMVLLKNEGAALPFSTDIKNLSVFGCTSYDFIAGGTGSGNVNHAYVVSLIDGLKNAGYSVNESLRYTYEQYLKAEGKKPNPNGNNAFAAFLPKPLPEELALSEATIEAQAETSDAALITIGRLSGEFIDRTEADFNLSDAEHKLIDNVCKAFHQKGKKVVVVMNIGGVVETASWKDKPDAILCAWQAGQEGGNSVADVLSGKESPSGKLTMTFPINFKDAASSNNFPIDQEANIDITNKGEKKEQLVKNVDFTNYEEDIYVGYRYFDSFDKTVSYPFGYGLSYTTFSYENPQIESDGKTVTITVDVKNTGNKAGKEVVELYVAAPDAKTANKPDKELKAFAKTAALQPGQTATVTMSVKAADLASFSEAKSAWQTTAGTYRFLVAASSRDIRATLSAKVKAYKQKTGNLLKPQERINILVR